MKLGKLFISLFVLFISYYLVVFFQITARGTFEERDIHDISEEVPIFDKLDVARRFSESLTFKTITHKNPEEFSAFLDFLKESFPLFHSVVELTILEFGLFYEWKGLEPALDPVVFLSHIDVVEAEGSENQWTFPPFGGQISPDGFVYGRGSMDDKIGVIGTLQAIELLLEQGKFVPRRSLFLCFSMDEELIEYNYGAKNMSQILRERNITPFFLMDEAGAVVEGVMSNLGISNRVGVVNIAEKGVIKLNISLECGEGHATFEKSIGCIEHMTTLVKKLMSNTQTPGHAKAFLVPFLDTIMPFSSLIPRSVYSLMKCLPNSLFEWVLEAQLSKEVKLNKAIRSTFNFREIHFDSHERGYMIVSIRLHPLDNTEEILEMLKKISDSISDGSDNVVKISLLSGLREAKSVSCVDCEPYRILKKSIELVYGDEGRQNSIIVAPYLNIAGSDLHYYRNLTKGGYNFSPLIFRSDEDFKMIHGVDEKVSVDDYSLSVKFFCQLILNLNK